MSEPRGRHAGPSRSVPGLDVPKLDPWQVAVGLLAVALAAVVLWLVTTASLWSPDPTTPGVPSSGSEGALSGAEAEERAPKAARAAEEVMDAWSRPDADAEQWWRELEPLLTPGAREAYAFTDPRQVPELGELELDEIVPGPSPDTVTVWFSTSDGRFGVDLARRGADSAWRASRILFPGQESMFE
jgi:hypothetical protein